MPTDKQNLGELGEQLVYDIEGLLRHFPVISINVILIDID
jgi:hypothetical protein